jgi:hypothetical protein
MLDAANEKKLNENLFLRDTFFPEEEVATQLPQSFTETVT